MRLSISPINNYINNNHWSNSDEWQISSGEDATLYFQLMDSSQQIRYMSQTGAAVSVTFFSLNGDIVKTASVVDPSDSSIFSVDILATDKVSSGNVKVTLVESGKTKASTSDILRVQGNNVGGSCCGNDWDE